MTEQLELFNQRKRNRRMVADDLERLINLLERSEEPLTAKQIKSILSFDDRWTRHLAEQSQGEILGTDQGYELSQFAPDDRFEGWAARYRSQIDRMRERLNQTMNHRTFAKRQTA